MSNAFGIEGPRLIPLVRHEDARGFFCETFAAPHAAAHGVTTVWIQDNEAFSRKRGTVRGLHAQRPPFAQAKLVRVVRGAIFDVAVDIREGSISFGRHVAIELSADRAEAFFVPAGFAHGYCTLSDDTLVHYKVDAPYAQTHETTLLWSDSDLAIRWPISPDQVTISSKDAGAPSLAAFAKHGSA